MSIEESTIEPEIEAVVVDDDDVTTGEGDAIVEDVIDDNIEVDDDDVIEPVDEVDGETVVTFGDDGIDEENPQDTAGIKKLRKKHREQAQKIRELEKQLQPEAKAEHQLGPRPTLESAEFDEDLYSDQLTQWLGHKAYIEQEQRRQQDEIAQQTQSWNDRLGEFEQARKNVVSDDYEIAEDNIKASLNQVQQGILVQVLGGKLTHVIMGLGKNAQKLKDLSDIKDNVMFAAAAGRLEAQMKISKRTPLTTPETRVQNNAGSGAGNNDVLAELRKKADKSGDLTEVMAYKRRMKQAS